MLIDDVQQAMFSAMKARQARETAALRLALSALKSAAIDARGELSDEQAVAVLQREARKRREAEQVYRDAGRAEQADQEAYEHSVLERFLPAALGPAELSRLVDEAVAVLQRESRKRREAEQVYRDAGRAERAEQEAYERSVLERFLPAGLDPAELARLVDEAVAASGASGPKELGKVMGRLMPQVKGRADGNEVRRLVLERLGG